MDLSTIVVNIANDILAFQALALTVAVGVGIFFCGGALLNAIKKSGSPGADVSGRSIFASFFIGALVLNFSGAMTNTIGTLGGDATNFGGLISYSGASAAGGFANVINAVLTIASTFGWWYSLKGWTMLRKATNGGGGGGFEDYAWKGLIHILGGAALVNITGTLDAFQATLGAGS